MNRLDCDRMFLSVMEAGSFTGSADARHQLGPGVEAGLAPRGGTGVRLLNRTTRSVSPTEAGRAPYDRLRVLVEELDRPDTEIRNISQTRRGRRDDVVLMTKVGM